MQIGLSLVIPNGQIMIADSYPENARGKAFGALYLTGALGAMFGTLYATNMGKHLCCRNLQGQQLPDVELPREYVGS